MHNFTFTDQEFQILQMALGELPIKVGFPLLQSINRQMAEKQQPKPAEEPAAD